LGGLLGRDAGLGLGGKRERRRKRGQQNEESNSTQHQEAPPNKIAEIVARNGWEWEAMPMNAKTDLENL
jgi:hypothetical protein